MARRPHPGLFSGDPRIDEVVAGRYNKDRSRTTREKEPASRTLNPEEELKFFTRNCVPALRAYADDLLKKSRDTTIIRNDPVTCRKNAFLIKGALTGNFSHEPELLLEDGRIRILRKCLEDVRDDEAPVYLSQHASILTDADHHLSQIEVLQRNRTPSPLLTTLPSVPPMVEAKGLAPEKQKKRYIQRFATVHCDTLLNYFAKDLLNAAPSLSPSLQHTANAWQEGAFYVRGLLSGVKEHPKLLLEDDRLESIRSVCKNENYTKLSATYAAVLKKIDEDLDKINPPIALEEQAKTYFTDFTATIPDAFRNYIQRMLEGKPKDQEKAFLAIGILAGISDHPGLLYLNERAEILRRSIIKRASREVGDKIGLEKTLEQLQANASEKIPVTKEIERPELHPTITTPPRGSELDNKVKKFVANHLSTLDEYIKFLMYSLPEHKEVRRLRLEKIFPIMGVLTGLESAPGLLLMHGRLALLKTIVREACPGNEREKPEAFIWPGHMPEMLAMYKELENIQKQKETSPPTNSADLGHHWV